MLSYKEFMDIVLPKEHPDLRAFVTQKDCFELKHDEFLSYESEAALVDLLDKEVTLLEELIPEKKRMDELRISAEIIVEIIDPK